MPDVSLAISARDENFSGTIKRIDSVCKAFDKTTEGLQKRLDMLRSDRRELYLSTEKAQKELKALQKEFRKTNTDEDGKRVTEAQEKYDSLADKLALLSKHARQTTDDMIKLSLASNKVDFSTTKEESTNTGGIAEGGSILSTIGKSGIIKEVGEVIQKGASYYVGSAFGEDAGTIFGSTISGAASGAAMGTLIGGAGIGTAIGAVAGGALGAVTGGIQVKQKEDDYFKSHVKSIYDSTESRMNETLTEGSTVAGGREQQSTAFTTMLGGDKEKSGALVSDMRRLDNESTLSFDDVSRSAKTLLQYGLSDNRVMGILKNVGDVSLGNSENFGRLSFALAQTRAAGKLTAQDRNQFVQAGFNPLEEMSRTTGKSMSVLMEEMKEGKISFEDVAKAFETATSAGGRFMGALEAQSKTFEGKKSIFEGNENNLKSAMGSAYNEEVGKGMDAKNELYGNEYGSRLESVYEEMGRYKGELEKKKMELEVSTLKELMDSEEFKSAEKAGDGRKLWELEARAKSQAENAYYSSDEYKQMIETQENILRDVRRSSIKSGAAEIGYDFLQEFYKGAESTAGTVGSSLGQAVLDMMQSTISNSGSFIFNVTPTFQNPDSGVQGPGFTANDHTNATGINRVPYNGYWTELHEDEMVIPGSRARGMKDGAKPVPPINITITGNSVREDSDIDRIAAATVEKIVEQFNLT